MALETRTIKTADDMPDRCNSINFGVKSPAGSIVVFFKEDEKENLIGIEIFLGKPGTEARAWAHALSRILTHALLNKQMKLTEIYQELTGITTDRSIMDQQLNVRSGPEAVA